MKDLHCHLIYGVDDGSRDLEETKKLLDSALEEGITDIVLTPHYVLNGKFKSNVNHNKMIFDTFNDYNNINLYLGNEICVNEDINILLENNEVMSINNSKYILIEFYKFAIYPNALNVVHELKIHGYIPIIAHPERYDTYMFNYNFFNDLIDNGCLLQGNYASLTGYYGKDAEKMLKEMLKRKMIFILASDNHRIDNNKYPLLNKAKRKLKHIVSKEYMNQLLDSNFDIIVNNMDIENDK